MNENNQKQKDAFQVLLTDTIEKINAINNKTEYESDNSPKWWDEMMELESSCRNIYSKLFNRDTTITHTTK